MEDGHAVMAQPEDQCQKQPRENVGRGHKHEGLRHCERHRAAAGPRGLVRPRRHSARGGSKPGVVDKKSRLL